MATRARSRTKSSGGPKAPQFSKMAALNAATEKEFGASYVDTATRSAGRDTYIDTGILQLDLGLMGGIPENKITMLLGKESSGKTTLAMKLCATAQRKYPGKRPLWIDAERTYDQDWGRKNGVDPDQLFFSSPPQAEMIVDIVEGAMKTGEVSLIVLDSLPAMIPRTTMENSAYDKQVADRARLIGVMISKINGEIANIVKRKEKCSVVFINQWRQVIGGAGPRGPTKQSSGGNQPRLFSAVIIELWNKEDIGAGKGAGGDDQSLGRIAKFNTHGFKITKAKTGNSLKDGEYDVIRDPDHEMGEGYIDDYLATLTFAKRFSLYDGVGAKQKFIGGLGIDETFRSKEDAISFLTANPDAYRTLKQAVIGSWRTRVKLPAIPPDGWLAGGYVE